MVTSLNNSAPTPDASKLDAEGVHFVRRGQFIGLARRCRLSLDEATLDRLGKAGVLLPQADGHLAPCQLWLLARYLDAVTFQAHQWTPWPANRPVTATSQLDDIVADARTLHTILEAVHAGRIPTATSGDVVQLVKRMRQWLLGHQTLGALRDLLPFLRADLRVGLSGEALMVELISDFCERMERLCGLSEAVASLASRLSGPVEPSIVDDVLSVDDGVWHDEGSLDAAPVVVSDQTSAATRQDASSSIPWGDDSIPTEEILLEAATAQSSASSVEDSERSAARAANDTLPDDALPVEAPGAGQGREVVASASAASDDGVGDGEEVAPQRGAREPVADDAERASASPQGDEAQDAMESPSMTSWMAHQGDVTKPSLELGDPAEVSVSVALAMSGEAAATRKGIQAPTKPPEVEGGGLRSALAKAREAARQRSIHSDSRHKARPLPMTASQQIAISDIEQELLKEGPRAQDKASDEPDGDAQDLEAQVLRLNTLRQQYVQAQDWEKLVGLYEEGIHLFQEPADRKGVYLYIAAFCEQKLQDSDRAMRAYEAALEIDPGDWDAYQGAERLLAAQERWPELMELIERALDNVEAAELRFALGLRQASLLATVLQEPSDALVQYRLMLERDLNSQQRREVLDGITQLIRAEDVDSETQLAAATILEGFWSIDAHGEELTQLYEDMFDLMISRDKQAAAEVMSRLATTYQATDQLRSAFVALVRAINCNPEREDIFIRLEKLAERLDGLRELAAIYEDDFETVFGQNHRAMLGRRLAGIYQRLNDPEGVRRAWQMVCDADPFDVDALMRLADAEQRAGHFDILMETLDRLRSLVEGPPRTQLLLRLAAIRTAGLTDPDGPAAVVMDLDAAVTALQDALANVEAGSSMALRVVDQIRDLIKHASQALAFQLAELLEQHFAQHGDYQSIIDVYEQLVGQHLTEDADRIEAGRLMTRIGQLHEEQLDQNDMAFLYYAKALRLDPDGDAALGRLLEMATEPELWEELAALYEEILDGQNAPIPELWLRRLAILCEEQLGDDERAFSAYHRLFTMQRDDERVLDFLERYHTSRQQWPEIVNILFTRADAEGVVAERKALLERAVTISLEKMGNVGLATSTLRRILTIDPEDASLTERLAVLYRSHGQHDELAEFLARQAELARDPDVRAEVMLRQAELLSQNAEQRDEALEVLTRLRSLRPQEPRVLRLMESLYTVEGRDLEAYAVLRSLYELLQDPNVDAPTDAAEIDGVLMRLAAMAESLLHSADEAAIHYKTLLERDPHNLQAIGQLERIYEENQLWTELVSVLQKHIQLMLQKDEKVAAVVLIERQLELATEQLADTDLELSCLSRLMRLGGTLNLAQVERLVDLARQQEQWRLCLEANEAFIGLLDERADQAAVLQEMAALALENIGDAPLAMAYLERARDACPEHPAVLAQLAERYRAEQRWPQLVDVLRVFIDLEDQSLENTVRRCRELSEIFDKHMNEPRQAVGLLERALGLVREMPEQVPASIQDSVRRRAVHLYTRLGESEAALTHLDSLAQAVEARSEGGQSLARIHEEMARLHLKLDHVEAADLHYQRAVAEDPAHLPARLGLAEVHLMRERYDEAIELVEALEERLDEFSSATDRGRLMSCLGRAYSATKKVGKAAEAFKRALEHDPSNAAAREALE